MKPPNERAPSDAPIPLCVDLDGTLIRTDLLAESLLGLVKAAPWKLALVPLWLLRGRAFLKRRLAELVPLSPASLPYDEQVLSYLREQKRAGRDLVLATASDETYARAVARHVGLFSDVAASDGAVNLKGERKLAELRRRFPGGFDYLDSSAEDQPVGRTARRGGLPAAVAALRPHHWSKNLLIFVPLITSHQIADPELRGLALRAVVTFSFCASAVYVLNDMLDLAHDRAHAVKRARPFASGALPLTWGPALIAAALAAAALAGRGLPEAFWLVVALYFATTLAYSLRLKEAAMLDVLCLTGLYTLRVFAGHMVTGIPLSPWLLAFSLFVFLSLALLKRYTEVSRLPAGALAGGRAYRGADAPVLLQMGLATAYLAVMVFALYINSDQVARLYRRPMLLWIVCVILFYALSRIWLLASRGRVDDDPVLFSLGDAPSYVCVLLTLATLAAASRP